MINKRTSGRHIESVNAEKFRQWLKYDSFDVFAQHVGENGHVTIGATGTGKLAIKVNKKGCEPEFYTYETIDELVQAYHELYVPI